MKPEKQIISKEIKSYHPIEYFSLILNFLKNPPNNLDLNSIWNYVKQILKFTGSYKVPQVNESILNSKQRQNI